MVCQILAKDILIIGDSNVRRYLFRPGKHYAQCSDFGVARNNTELAEALKLIVTDKYRIVIFAMLTNLVVDAGFASGVGPDQTTRLNDISESTSNLLQELK